MKWWQKILAVIVGMGSLVDVHGWLHKDVPSASELRFTVKSYPKGRK